MTSGIPLSENEQQYIRNHIADGPARIAFELGQQFSEVNGGCRKKETVKKFIRRERSGRTLIITVPGQVMQQAREKGISADQLQFIALRAVLQRVKGVS